MPYVLAVIVGLALLVAAGNAFTKLNPGQLALVLRRSAATVLLGTSGFLALRGFLPVAIPLFLLGLGLLGIRPFAFQQRTPGQKSRVSTSLLAMELDHDSGNMDGRVLSGRFEGRELGTMELRELLDLREEALGLNDQSAVLLDAFLDRRDPSWREAWSARHGAGQGDGANRSSNGSGRSGRNGRTAMGREEALQVLGLAEGATEEEIRSAHRRMMKNFHPDHGGSDYLAAKINQAKDVLLGV
jgi:DnaJ domain